MTTETRTADETLTELRRKLDFWEMNLRVNREHHSTREDLSPETREECCYGIDRELGVIDAVRDVINPGWAD